VTTAANLNLDNYRQVLMEGREITHLTHGGDVRGDDFSSACSTA
jgi:hypothetical protein